MLTRKGLFPRTMSFLASLAWLFPASLWGPAPAVAQIPDAAGAVTGLATAPVAAENRPQVAELAVTDVALGRNNELVGRAMNRQGQPWAGVRVELLQDNRVVAAPLTDDKGEFRVRQLRGGIYQLRAQESLATCRLWVAGTAPPAAAAGATLVQGVQRGQGCTTPGCSTIGCGGQCGAGSPLGILLHPVVVGAAVTAAIAIPLALDDDDDGASN